MLVFLNNSLQDQDNFGVLGIIAENLDCFRSGACTVRRGDTDSYGTVLTWFKMARTSHHGCTSSRRMDFLYDKIICSSIAEFKSELQLISLPYITEVMFGSKKINSRPCPRNGRKQHDKNKKNSFHILMIHQYQ